MGETRYDECLNDNNAIRTYDSVKILNTYVALQIAKFFDLNN